MPVVKVKGIPMDLGGTVYVVPPLSLGALEQLEERLAAFTGDASDRGQLGTVIDALHSALRRNYPALTRAEVAEMIDVGTMMEVMQAVMDVSGMRRKDIETKARAATGGASGEA